MSAPSLRPKHQAVFVYPYVISTLPLPSFSGTEWQPLVPSEDRMRNVLNSQPQLTINVCAKLCLKQARMHRINKK